MIILIGKTASGKDTILNNLITRHGYKKIVTYTTRPMRYGEKQDTTYHFISEEDFRQKIKEGFFIEWSKYNTKFGDWYYGTAISDINNAKDNDVIILSPNGYRYIVAKMPNKAKSIYIYSNNSTIKERLISRCDNKEEAQRRLKQDNIDFNGIEHEVHKIVYNNKDDNINDIINSMLKWVNEEKK